MVFCNEITFTALNTVYNEAFKLNDKNTVTTMTIIQFFILMMIMVMMMHSCATFQQQT
jgi:hypothetical protein